MSKYTKEQLRSVFQRPFDKETWKTILIDIFRANNVRVEPEKFTDPDQSETGWYMGNIETTDNYRIGLFFYRINIGSVAHKKVGLRNLVKSWVNPNWGKFDAAIVVFSDGTDWRLSFVCDIKDVATAPKRFTFVFGEKDNFYRTPIDRFTTLQDEEPTFKNIHKAFSVEALSDDFFDQYRDHYADFVEFVTGKRYVKDGSKWVERVIHKPNYQYSDTFGSDDKLVRDYVKKMFGRIVFLYFLQRKGWLDGNRNYMHDLFVNSDKKDDFLDGVLEPLFFEILNTDKPYRTVAAKALPGSDNIPYLNGGLFAADEIDELDCKFPESLFSKFFNFLDSYNFTIDENDTDDAEIGIDPEMLGRIFENLLEDNKDKGAFYTPKEIVDYMCRESIIAYLQNEKFTDNGNETIRKFVETYDGTSLSIDQRKYLKDKLKSVKICDPAIGSGAFPMGLVNLLSKLYSALRLSTDSAMIKRHIMEQNIYGVDIEKGAVDIARLRFWLAMIVEEKDPIPLPNLHFKIMQGNSLLESYQGVDLSDMTKVKPKVRSLFDSDDTERETLVVDLKKYYKISDHAERDRLFNDIIKNVRRQLFAKGITLPQGMDPSANEFFFLWHTWFTEVFEYGGFDIVIGNPPYGANLSEEDKSLYRKLYPEAEFKIDTYSLFVLLSFKLLKDNGIMYYIIPNTLLDNYFEESVRKKLLSHKILEINDLSDKIFENAVVHSMIFGYQKISTSSDYKIRCDIGDGLKDDVFFVNSSFFEKQQKTLFSIRSWSSRKIYEKLRRNSVNLQDVLNIRQAIKSGDDKTYITSTRVSSTYKPILRGKDVKRFSIIEPGLFIHYGSFLACPRTPGIFEQPKILIREAGATITAAIDYNNNYIMSSLYNCILIDNRYSLEYLLGLINSKLFQHLMNKLTFEKTKGAFTKAKIYHYYELPVKKAASHEQDVISNYVKRIMSKSTSGEDTNKDEKQLNIAIFKLYDLTFDEIQIIDPETTITREEY